MINPFKVLTNPFIIKSISSTLVHGAAGLGTFTSDFLLGGDKLIGRSANSAGHSVWSFNSTLRKRIFQSAAGASILGSMKSIVNYQDPNIPVYDYTQKGNMGSDGLGLALYYNNK